MRGSPGGTSRGAFSSAYGAAGSLVVLLAWVFWSAQILFLGAEFTRAYAESHGSRIRPEPHAEREDEVDDRGKR